MTEILSQFSDSLADAGTVWEKAVKVSFFLHRSEKPETLQGLFRKTVKAEIAKLECSFVDGYASEGNFFEIEVTARL